MQCQGCSNTRQSSRTAYHLQCIKYAPEGAFVFQNGILIQCPHCVGRSPEHTCNCRSGGQVELPCRNLRQKVCASPGALAHKKRWYTWLTRCPLILARQERNLHLKRKQMSDGDTAAGLLDPLVRDSRLLPCNRSFFYDGGLTGSAHGGGASSSGHTLPHLGASSIGRRRVSSSISSSALPGQHPLDFYDCGCGGSHAGACSDANRGGGNSSSSGGGVGITGSSNELSLQQLLNQLAMLNSLILAAEVRAQQVAARLMCVGAPEQQREYQVLHDVICVELSALQASQAAVGAAITATRAAEDLQQQGQQRLMRMELIKGVFTQKSQEHSQLLAGLQHPYSLQQLMAGAPKAVKAAAAVTELGEALEALQQRYQTTEHE